MERFRVGCRCGRHRSGIGDLHRRSIRPFDLNAEPTRTVVDEKATAAIAVKRVSFTAGGTLNIDAHEAPRADQILLGRPFVAGCAECCDSERGPCE